ncbi:MAG TPA: lysoplasmalogenase family protein [Sediminibacterium sp.]|nr:lysoplasmalogenase family protein [Sediminibacterium sp.]
MEAFLRKNILGIYWIIVAVSCCLLFLNPLASSIFEVLFVPVLLTYLFIQDPDIGQPAGKFIFYVGLFLAFMGDFLQIVIDNQLFFVISIIAYLLMNICYGICFYSLHPLRSKSAPIFLKSLLVFGIIGTGVCWWLWGVIADFRLAVIVYVVAVNLVIASAFHLSTNPGYRQLAYRYIIPACLLQVVQNVLLISNMMFWGSRPALYAFSLVPYAAVQYLFVKGFWHLFLVREKL